MIPGSWRVKCCCMKHIHWNTFNCNWISVYSNSKIYWTASNFHKRCVFFLFFKYWTEIKQLAGIHQPINKHIIFTNKNKGNGRDEYLKEHGEDIGRGNRNRNGGLDFSLVGNGVFFCYRFSFSYRPYFVEIGWLFVGCEWIRVRIGNGMGQSKSNGHRRGESGGRNRRGQKGCRVFMGVKRFATRYGGRHKNSGHFCFFEIKREIR